MRSFILLLVLVCLPALRAEEPEKPRPAPEYSTLLGEGLSGSGFHFAAGGQRYIACSLHQFDGEAPSVMGSMEFDEPIVITGRVYAGKDIQVLRYTSAELDKHEALKFDQDVVPAIGDKVYCYSFDESFEGSILSAAADKRNYSVKMSVPYPAGGNSGTPVVSAVTGTVVGVLLTADDPEAAMAVGFELLKPKPKAEQESAQQSAASRFGDSPENRQLDRLMKIFPSLFWYAGDACIRETTKLDGHFQKHEDFVSENEARVREIEASEMDGKEVPKAEVVLVDPNEPEEHWILEFVYTDGRWNAHSGYKYFGAERTFDIYESDIFMGSMKPYVQKGLEAFAEGVNIAAVFEGK